MVRDNIFKDSNLKNLDFDPAKDVERFDKEGSESVKRFAKGEFFK